ncbi:hypothetical protein G6F56_012954 [Rhizopus delemar]|nr:hypothetical protein G6F56_012954 [Rhizopus delemar]
MLSSYAFNDQMTTSTAATPVIASTMLASSHYEQNGRHSLYANNRMIIDPPVTDTRNHSVLSEDDEWYVPLKMTVKYIALT